MIYRAEWTKGFCHVWSMGRHFSLSLPPCLAIGILNLAPKATSVPKSRGASFGTTPWYHV